MRYRREDADGDYTFGQGDDTFLIDSPECVAQARFPPVSRRAGARCGCRPDRGTPARARWRRNGRDWFTIVPDLLPEKVARGNAGRACDMSTTHS